MTKQCSACKLVKPLDGFYLDQARPLGRQSRCKDCAKAHAKEWHQRNPADPERRREILRQFRERNPEKDSEYGRRWWNKDPERALELARARGQKWRQTKPERKIASEWRRRARLQAVTPTDEDYIAVLRGDPCSYCGAYGQTVDHIEPLHFGGPVGWENLTAACRSCNASKRIDSFLLFLLRTAKQS